MATPQERLTEAETALHDLMTGKSVVEVRDADGSSIRYTIANRGALSAYIETLRREIDSTRCADGPLRPFFL